jgi:hypothetical protein
MPGPLIPKPTLPDVLDPPATGMDLSQSPDLQILPMLARGAFRRIVGLLGLDDPNQVMAVGGAALEAGPSGGGILDTLARKYPRFAQALQQYAVGPPREGTTLADVIKPAGEGRYALRADALRRVEASYRLGALHPQLANWDGVTDELLQAFAGDREKAVEWARLWGATSPGTSAPVTNREAISAVRYRLLNPDRPLTVRKAQTMNPVITMAPSKVPNINRAYAGEALGTPKVEEMSQLLMGPLADSGPHVPFDVHAIYGVGADSDTFDTQLKHLRALMTKAEGLPARGGLTDREIYYRMANALSDGLEQIAPGLPSSPTFATFWEGVRTAKGLPAQGGPIDLLRAKGLLQMGAMLDPARLAAVLKTSGWSAPAIAGLLSALPPGTPVPEGSQ